MKRVHFGLLLIVAVGYVAAQSSLSCPSGGKFLGMLKKINKDIVLSAPKTDTASFTVCKEVWTEAGGTCCDTTALNNGFDDKMKNGMKKGFDDFIGGLKRVRPALDKIKKLATNKDELKTKLTTAYTANPDQFGGATVDQNLETLAYAETFPTEVETFKTKGKECFDAIKEAAGKLFCYGCSAKQDTTNIETTDGSTAISTDSCTSLISKCFDSWRFMHRVGGMMQAVSIINRIFGQTKQGQTPTGTTGTNAMGPPPSDQTSTTSTGGDTKIPDKPAFGGLKLEEVIAAWKNCEKSDSATCTDSVKATLCKANFNVMAPPKRANNNNMGADNMSQLSDDGKPPAPPKRVLQGASESSGDVTITSTGLNLNKAVTTPTTTATVDSSTSTSSGAIYALSGFISLLLALLN